MPLFAGVNNAMSFPFFYDVTRVLYATLIVSVVMT